MQLLLDGTQSNLNFEPSFVGLHQALKYGFLNINVKLEILANFEFWEYQICEKIVHKIAKFHSYFQLKLKRKGKI